MAFDFRSTNRRSTRLSQPQVSQLILVQLAGSWNLFAMFLRRGRNLPSGFIEHCLPSSSDRPRAGTEWVHEIKHDGYRLMVWRSGNRIRLFTRRGYDWSVSLCCRARRIEHLDPTSRSTGDILEIAAL
jgi:hypothetical protein